MIHPGGAASPDEPQPQFLGPDEWVVPAAWISTLADIRRL